MTFWDNDAGSKIHLLANPGQDVATYDDTVRNIDIGRVGYLRHSFIAGFPTERVPKMPLSGVSTRSGDLARFTFKGLDGTMTDLFIHLVRALAPEEVIHIDLGENGCDKCITQNSPRSMRVWPGLRLIGAGGKIPKGVFVAVAEVEPDGVRLDNGMRLKNQELLRATRPSHAVTYASCQLTLHKRVRLDLESCHLTLRHLYVGA